MRFTVDRYGALARKHGMPPEDAAVAAFDAMLNGSTRTAHDPWAVVTVAVKITLGADERAHGMLTSVERARRPEYSVFHDATRFADHESELTDYHPAFRIAPADAALDDEGTDATTDAASAVESTVIVLTLLDWPEDAARAGVDYLCSRLLDYGSRTSAYEALRRDKTARALLDLPHKSWIGLLRIVLGHPAARGANARRGTLVRLLIGETVADLLSDDDLVLAIALANPEHTQQR